MALMLGGSAAAEPVVAAHLFQDNAEQAFALAANRYALEDWERAAEAFEGVIQEFPASRQAVVGEFFLGECLVQLSRYGDAYPHYVAFVRAEPDSEYLPQAVYRVGESAYLSSDLKGAEEWLVRFLRDYPQHVLAAYARPYLGDIYFERHDLAKAREQYVTALTDHPQSPLVNHCRMGMARIFEIEGKPDESLRFLQLISEDSSALAGDALYETLRLHREAGDSAQVRATGTRYLQRFQDGPYVNAVRILMAEAMQVDGELDAAFALIESTDQSWDLEDRRVNEIAPGVLFRLAKARWDNDNDDSARQLLNQIQTRWPNSEWGDDALELLVRHADEQDQHDEVLRLSERFLETYPTSSLLPYVRELQGRSLYDDQNFAAAESAFAEAWQHGRNRDDISPEFKANLLYLHGLSLIATERHALAIEQLKQAFPLLDIANQQADLTESPSKLRSGLHLALATAYTKSQLHNAATSHRETFLKLETDTEAARDCAVDLVLDYLEVGNLVKADAWSHWLTENFPPGSASGATRWEALLQNVAESAFVKQEWSVAESAFAMLAEHATNNSARAKGNSGLAWAKYKQEDFAAAEVAFEASIAEQSTGEVAAEATYLLGRLAERSGQTDDAIQWYARVEAADPNSKHVADSLLRRARLLRRDDDADARIKSLELYDRAWERQADDLDVLLYEKAWLLLGLEKDEEGFELFARLVADHPQSRYWCDAAYRLAEHRTETNQFDEADRLLQQVLARDDGEALRPFANYLLGQNAARRNAWPEVLSAMNAVVNLDEPHDLSPAALYWKGEAHFRLDEHQEAQACFQKLANDTPNVDPTWLPTIRLRLAQLTALKGDWGNALQQAHEMQTAKQKLAQPYELDYLVGRCLSSMGRFTEAREAYAEVIRSPIGARTETAAKSQWMIGESFFHQEQWDEAIDAFEKVEVLYGYPQWQAAAILQAGKCHEQAGRWKQAVKLYARLLREHPDSEYVAEASERLKVAGQLNRTQR